MKKIIRSIVGKGTHDKPYTCDVELGVTHKAGDIIISEIEVDKRGKPKVTEIEVIILEKGVDF